MLLKKNLSLFTSKKLIYFIYLIPAFLVTGPAIPDIVISISAIYFLIITFRNKLYIYFNNIFFKFFIIFWIYLIFGSLISDNSLFSLKTSFAYLRFIIFSIFIYYLSLNYKNFVNNFYLSLLITISIVVLDGYFQFFFGYNLLGFPRPHVMERISGFFKDEWILGSYLSRMLPLLIAVFFYTNIKNKFFIKYFWFVIYATIVLVFLSGERASFLLSLITFFALLFFSKKKKLNFFFGIILILILTLVINFNSKTKSRMIDQTIKGFEFSKEKIIPVPKYFFTYGHTQHFFNAFRMFKDKPIVGHGANNFRNKCNFIKYSLGEFGCSSHPHNTYFQLLAETGIIGFSFILLIFFYFSLVVLKKLLTKIEDINLYKYHYDLFLKISFICTLFPLVTTGNFFHNWLNIIYFLPVGFYLHSLKIQNE